MPRWWSCTCAWVQASVTARSKAVASWCLSARSSASPRDGAISVQNATRAVAPGGMRTRRRRLKIGSSTVPTVLESGRPSITEIGVRMLAPAPEEARPVGLELHVARRVSPSHDGEVRRPDLGLAGRAPPPRRQQRADVGDELRLHEQLGEGRVGRVGGRRRQHDLGVRGQLDLAGAAAEVRDRHAAHLGVVLGETATSSVVVIVPSRRTISARSSENATS